MKHLQLYKLNYEKDWKDAKKANMNSHKPSLKFKKLKNKDVLLIDFPLCQSHIKPQTWYNGKISSP